MSDLLGYVIRGIPYGCVFALVAVGLVLTYKTSGVFNLAFAAQAFVSAATYYQLRENDGWGNVPAFLMAVVVVAPLLGLVLERFIFRHLRTAPAVAKLVASLGLLVALPQIVALWIGSDAAYGVPTIWPNQFGVYHFLDYAVDGNEIATIIATVVSVVGLTLLFRYSSVGLRMRAVVESPRMTALAGINPDRISALSWMLSSLFAGLAGVLISPLFSQLAATNFTILLIAAIAAAAFARLTSIPMALLGGLLLGILQGILAGYLPLNSVLANGLRPSLPFVLLFLLLLFWPGLRQAAETADPMAGVDPPPPASTVRATRLGRAPAVAAAVALAAGVDAVDVLARRVLAADRVRGVIFAVIFLSITVITGMAGQISLCQATFAAVGGFATAQAVQAWGLPVLLGTAIGVVLAAAVGALLAIPALRLGGIYLALATFAFALMFDSILVPLGWVSGGPVPLSVPRPEFLRGDHAFLLFSIAVLAVVGLLVILVRNGTTGKFLDALRGSETAAASIGIHGSRQRVHRVRALGRDRRRRRRPARDARHPGQLRRELRPVLRARVAGRRRDRRRPHGRRRGRGRARARAPARAAQRAGDLARMAVRALRARRAGLRPPPGGRARGAEAMGRRVRPTPRAEARRRDRDGERTRRRRRGARTAVSILDARNIVKRFSGITALEDVTLEVEPGESVGLIGPNGAGKTTLFDCVLGLQRPDAGSVHFDGRDVTRMPVYQRARLGMGRTFQRIELFGGMTVREHLVVADRSRRLGASTRRGAGDADPARSEHARADELLALLELDDVADHAIETLSLGRGRLVELARTLMTDPLLLLLDEPSSGLDARETQELVRTLRAVREERGTAVLLVEHDIEMVESFAHRLVVLEFGAVIAEGAPDAVMHDRVVRDAYLGEIADSAVDATEAAVEAATAPASAPVRSDHAEPLLELHEVDAGYGPFRALFGVSFTMQAGRVTALLGANGAGKSTVARVVSGLIRPTAGSVRFDGVDISRMKPWDIAALGIVHAPEGRSVFGSLTVEENLTLEFRRSLGRRGVAGGLERAFEMFPRLRDRRRAEAGTLSGGEQRMLSLARVLVQPPRLLVVDELSLGLAPIVVDEVYATLDRIRREGTTMLLIEQYVGHALRIADDVVVLAHGEVSAMGSVDELGDVRERLLPAPARSSG